MSSIPLPALNVQQPKSPFEQYREVLTLRDLMDSSRLRQQQYQQGQMQTQMMQQQMQDQQSFRQAMADPSMQGKTIGEIADTLAQSGRISPQSWQGMKKADVEHRKELAGLDETKLKNYKAAHDATEQIYGNVMNMPDQQLAQQWPQIVQQVKSIPGNEKLQLDPNQPLTKQQLAQFGPMISMGNTYFDQELERRTKAAQLPGIQADSLIKQQEAALSPMERAIKGSNALEYYAAQGDPKAQAALDKKIQVQKAGRPINNLMTRSDAQDIADAIENGDQPPTLQGLYRNAGPVRAELARRGVPLAKMETDWKATQKYLATLNGPQQVRIQQAITTASDSLDKIEGLYNEWQQLAPTSGFKVLNKASLLAMKNLPGRAGAVATQLEAQINDLASEIGNVYMGGNSPTDMALKMGASNLKADWNDETFREGLKQTRLNLGIRKNSIVHGSPAGLSGSTNYFQGGSNQAPPQAGGRPPLSSFEGR